VDHRDHVALIRDGVAGAGRRWLELGAGEGAFTLALADLLGPEGSIVAVDRDARALANLGERMAAAFPRTAVHVVAADFARALPPGPFDGVLAANSLHFLADPVPVLRSAAASLAPDGRVIVVEYDADRGNPWVPHPFSRRRFPDLAAAAGLPDVADLGRVPSRFLGAIWSAVARPPSVDSPR
jgi:ubiquinone/menaquinone biosynthesis C-methylase UbiE